MAVRIVQLGSPRAKGEGLRIGTVRRPPRGVPKAEFASRDFYDVWLPDLAPSEGLVKLGQSAASEKDWVGFREEVPERDEATRGVSDCWISLPRCRSKTNFAVGCYCPDEMHCHRSVLRNLLEEHGARFE